MFLLHPLDGDAIHMTLDEWWAGVSCDGFTPDDGGGYFAFADTRTDIVVLFDRSEYDRQTASIPADRRPTHVAWYPK